MSSTDPCHTDPDGLCDTCAADAPAVPLPGSGNLSEGSATLPDVNTTTEPQLPLGASHTDDTWDDDRPDGPCRLVWSEPMPLPEELAEEDIRVVVTQLVDGTIITEGTDQPLVYIDSSGYTVRNARALALAILAATDLADGWSTASPAAIDGALRIIDAHRRNLPVKGGA